MTRRALCLVIASCLLFVAGKSARASDVPAAPIDRPLPDYPTAANAIEGSVKLRFRIENDGRVTDVHVLEANPPGLFEAAAASAVSQWRYHPREADGQPVDQPDNAVVLKFKPPRDDTGAEILRPQRAYYPRKAFEEKLEGDVTVIFDVNLLGLAEHAVVLESTPPLVFDNAALKSLETIRFQPKIVDGKRQAMPGVKMTIPFRMATAELSPRLISSTPPSYPSKARNKGIQGYCMLSYWIGDDGSAERPEILDSYPRDVFRRTCLAYAATVKYARPGDDPLGHIDRRHTVQITFVFGGPGYTPHYDLKPGEWVRIQYTVTTDGYIGNATVIETSAPNVKTDSALEQIRRRHVKPRMVNGVAVEQPNQVAIVAGPDE